MHAKLKTNPRISKSRGNVKTESGDPLKELLRSIAKSGHEIPAEERAKIPRDSSQRIDYDPRLELIKLAANDPLFLQYVEEIMEDFKFVDAKILEA